jgi:zinc transport system permease protein
MDAVYESITEMAKSGALPEIFQHAFMVRAMLAAILVSPLLGLVGPLVLSKKMAFFSTTLGHAALTGLSIGILLGEPIDGAYVGIFGFCLITAVTMMYVRRRSTQTSDTVVGVFQAFVLGLGICLLVAVTQRFNIHQIQAVMFGDVLTVTDTDLLLLLVLGAIGGVYFVRSYNGHLLASLNPDLAAIRSDRTALADYLFVAALAVVIVCSLKIVGAFLVEALIVVPAASARNLSRSLKSWVWLSILFALLGSVFGLVLSSWFPVPSGGAIVLALSGIFVLTFFMHVVRGKS